MSRPTRGEWIEMQIKGIEKVNEIRLAPPGASGLKYNFLKKGIDKRWSRPTRGEWIEITQKKANL